MSREGRAPLGTQFPSPILMLTLVAVAMAGIGYVATQSQVTTEREVTTVASTNDPFPSLTPPAPTPAAPATTAAKPTRPRIQRSQVTVEVYNNTTVTGLAARVAAAAAALGWNVTGADNWRGNIPASTVYYPPQLERAARLLARDLGITRLRPAVDPMRTDRLTVILAADAA